MRAFRVAKTQYIADLSGEGAKLHGGRWNKPGDAMLYFSEHLSLCILEILVHIDFLQLPTDYSFMEIEIPDGQIRRIKSVHFIHPNWRAAEAVNQLQMTGSKWLVEKKQLAMTVPSAVIPFENNLLINPQHNNFNSNIQIIRTEKIDLDPRLFRK